MIGAGLAVYHLYFWHQVAAPRPAVLFRYAGGRQVRRQGVGGTLAGGRRHAGGRQACWWQEEARWQEQGRYAGEELGPRGTEVGRLAEVTNPSFLQTGSVLLCIRFFYHKLHTYLGTLHTQNKYEREPKARGVLLLLDTKVWAAPAMLASVISAIFGHSPSRRSIVSAKVRAINRD